MLVIHNFGVSATEITLTDKIEKAVGVNGGYSAEEGR